MQVLTCDNKIPPVGSYTYKPKPFEADFTGNIFFSSICNYLLNSATIHAQERKYGIEDLRGIDKAWVLNRFIVQINKYPHPDEDFIVETWPEMIKGIFTLRKFNLLNAKSEQIGYASSLWMMIDISSRRPQNISNYLVDVPLVKRPECPLDNPARLDSHENLKLSCEFFVKYSHLDVNRHVNSVKYIEWIIDTFHPQIFQKKELHQLQINYLSETNYGDKLQIRSSEVKNNAYYEIMRPSDNNVVTQSRLQWQKRAAIN